MKKAMKKWKRAVSVLMTALMVVTSLGAQKLDVSAYGSEDRYQGTYEISEITSTYAKFVREDALGTGHIMGPVAVGGRFQNSAGFDDVCVPGQVVPNYAGKIEMGGFGSRDGAKVHVLYYGTSDVGEPDGFVHNPGFMDMDEAFSRIEAQSRYIANQCSTPMYGNTLNLNGRNEDVYVRVTPEQFKNLNIQVDDATWYQNHALVISVVGVYGNDISTGTIRYNGQTPITYKDTFREQTGGTSVEVNLFGMNIFLNFPDANGDIAASECMGHLIAPKATATDAAQSQGCMIVKSFIGSGEAHYLPSTRNLPNGTEDVKTGSLELYKEKEDGTAFNGVKFGLYRDKDCNDLVTETTSQSYPGTQRQGVIRFSGVDVGTYYVKEMVTPAGYRNDDTAYGPYVVKADYTTYVQKAIVNYPQKDECTYSVFKRDGSGHPLKGAVIGIYRFNGNWPISDDNTQYVKSAVTGDDGMAYFYDMPNWPENTNGGYVFKELKAPDGYIISDNDYKGPMTQNGHWTLDFNDSPIQNITFNKVKITNGTQEELQGAVLTLYRKDADSLVGVETWVSNWVSDGKAHELDGKLLIVGSDYILREEAAPKGYKIATDIEFHVNEDGSIAEIGTSAYAFDANDRVIVMADDALDQWYFSKVTVDPQGEHELDGADMTLYRGVYSDDNAQLEVVESWTSGTTPHEMKMSELKIGETYTIREISAPNGYQVASNIIFTVNKDGNLEQVGFNAERFNDNGDHVIVMLDNATGTPTVQNVTFSKRAVSSTDELANAELVLKDSTGKVIDEWTTGATAHEVNGNKLKFNETYTLTETAAPNGYKIATTISFKIDESGNIVDVQKAAQATNPDQRIIVMEDAAIADLEISKRAVSSTDELADATLVLKDSTGKTIDSWTTGTEAHKVDGKKLKLNETYTLTETAAPDGYKIATTISFKIDGTGKVTNVKNAAKATNPDQRIIVMEDALISDIEISKRAVSSTDELADAELVLKDSTGKTIDSWTTGTEAHKVAGSKLKLNETYTLTETAAPDGYGIATTISFKIDGTGKITNVKNAAKATNLNQRIIVMEDAVIADLEISKRAVSSTDELADAELVLKDSTGKTIDSWTTGTEAHKVDGSKLKLNETYTLTETAAPDGYEIATTITFKIDGTGNVTNVKNAAEATNPNQRIIVMEDAVISDIEISKRAVSSTDELADAELVLKDSTGKTIDSWTTGTEAHKVDGSKLKLNETYTLTETAAPDGYKIATTITFKIDGTGKVTDVKNAAEATNPEQRIIVMEDAAVTDLEISKRAVSSTDELADATLVLKDSTGKTIDEWTTGATTHKVAGSKLKLNETYTLTETAAPDGYKIATTITFKIDGTGKVTNVKNAAEATNPDQRIIVMEDAVISDLEISKRAVSSTDELADAELVLKDSTGKTIDSWTTGTEAHKVDGSKLKLNETYTLTETAAPNGYKIATTITFKIDGTGKVTNVKNAAEATNPNQRIIVMEDAVISDLEISKRAVSSTDELADAELVLKDSTGKTIDSWTTGTEAHKVAGSKLKLNETYTLTETAAPNGYKIATTITFKIDGTGKVTNVKNAAKATNPDQRIIVMEDAVDTPVIAPITINKKAVGGGDELPGAELALYDVDIEDGIPAGVTPIESWTSGENGNENGHSVDVSLLEVGKTYTLREMSAPKGYKLASDIKFTINNDGSISSDLSSAIVNPDTRVIVMIDDVETPTVQPINISKVDIANGKEVAGAEIAIYEGSYSNGIPADAKLIESWISTTATHKVKAELKLNTVYTLVEKTAPKGYTVTTNVQFAIGADGTIDKTKTTATVNADGVILLEDAALDSIVISKVAMTNGQSKELPNANLALYEGEYSKNVPATLSPIISWTTGSKAENTQNGKEISGNLLQVGKYYTLVETAAPKGYEIATNIVFRINEDGSISSTSNPSAVNAQDRIIVMVDKLSSSPSPSPEGTPTPSPEGTPTPSPVGTPTPSPEGTPTPSPEGTPTPSPVGTPTPSPVGTPTPSPVGTPTPSPVGTPTPSPVGTPTPSPVVTPNPTETPVPGTTSTPNPNPSGSPTPGPTETPVPGTTNTPGPNPTVSPKPSVTPNPETTPGPSTPVIPTATPNPGKKSPKTGDSVWFWMPECAMLLLGGAYVVACKRKENE